MNGMFGVAREQVGKREAKGRDKSLLDVEPELIKRFLRAAREREQGELDASDDLLFSTSTFSRTLQTSRLRCQRFVPLSSSAATNKIASSLSLSELVDVRRSSHSSFPLPSVSNQPNRIYNNPKSNLFPTTLPLSTAQNPNPTLYSNSSVLDPRFLLQTSSPSSNSSIVVPAEETRIIVTPKAYRYRVEKRNGRSDFVGGKDGRERREGGRDLAIQPLCSWLRRRRRAENTDEEGGRERREERKRGGC